MMDVAAPSETALLTVIQAINHLQIISFLLNQELHVSGRAIPHPF